MRNFVMTLGFAGVLIASPVATPAVYGQDSQSPATPMNGPDMQRMMKMMNSMENCEKMMQAEMMQGGMMSAPGSQQHNNK